MRELREDVDVEKMTFPMVLLSAMRNYAHAKEALEGTFVTKLGTTSRRLRTKLFSCC